MFAPDCGEQLGLCQEMGKRDNATPADSEGAVGTSLGRVRSSQSPGTASNSCVLPEIWQPDPKGLLQIFGHKPRDFPTVVLLSPPLLLAVGKNILDQVGANPAPERGFVLGLWLGSEL